MATAPILLIIAIGEKWFTPGVAAGEAAASCHKKTIKPKAFVPRRLVRIVTVNPPKGFSYIDSSQGTRRMSPQRLARR
jgi:hypothetical protein